VIVDRELPVDVIQLDDGYQRELGDWLTPSSRFESLSATVARIRDSGRRAGIWIAPFLVGARSGIARALPPIRSARS
jgi:alpha-galactosidase